MAATPGARGVILRTAITEPSNYRARNISTSGCAPRIIGLSGIDTRALTPRSAARHGRSASSRTPKMASSTCTE